MSLLSRDQVRIFVGPQQVALLRLKGGAAGPVSERFTVACEDAAAEEPAWRAAVDAVGALLEEAGTQAADAVVVLSNHFVRYTLVAHSEAAGNTAEEQALIRHHFSRIYGPAVDGWTLRLSDTGGGAELRVASAIDNALHASLGDHFRSGKLTLRSIQPYLMAAFNQLRGHFTGSAWFALVEQGALCLARFENQLWQSVRTVRIGEDWLYHLAVQLERDRLRPGATGVDAGDAMPIFVYAPASPAPSTRDTDERTERLLQRHAVRLIHPSRVPDDIRDAEPHYAMALAG